MNTIGMGNGSGSSGGGVGGYFIEPQFTDELKKNGNGVNFTTVSVNAANTYEQKVSVDQEIYFPWKGKYWTTNNGKNNMYTLEPIFPENEKPFQAITTTLTKPFSTLQSILILGDNLYAIGYSSSSISASLYRYNQEDSSWTTLEEKILECAFNGEFSMPSGGSAEFIMHAIPSTNGANASKMVVDIQVSDAAMRVGQYQCRAHIDINGSFVVDQINKLSEIIQKAKRAQYGFLTNEYDGVVYVSDWKFITFFVSTYTTGNSLVINQNYEYYELSTYADVSSGKDLLLYTMIEYKTIISGKQWEGAAHELVVKCVNVSPLCSNEFLFMMMGADTSPPDCFLYNRRYLTRLYKVKSLPGDTYEMPSISVSQAELYPGNSISNDASRQVCAMVFDNKIHSIAYSSSQLRGYFRTWNTDGDVTYVDALCYSTAQFVAGDKVYCNAGIKGYTLNDSDVDLGGVKEFEIPTTGTYKFVLDVYDINDFPEFVLITKEGHIGHLRITTSGSDITGYFMTDMVVNGVPIEENGKQLLEGAYTNGRVSVIMK